ncbi:hypothetical protein PHMEG_00018988 [Phytophthora megakarya]|uniref:Uncharacterized protein n=1 Tax=Phytophthora megakarya TaxID=4795 RepID=A0A225VSN5_9STRA|nr:hypothetical protein PHMEG_00018988 [Phytophthora megakarya]
MLGTTQTDQKVGRVLSGWIPKEGAKFPSHHALDRPIRDCARDLQVLLFANTLAFADSALNLEGAVAECLTATVGMHCPNTLLLDDHSAPVCGMRGVMAEQSVMNSREKNCETSSAVLELVKKQSEQIGIRILQSKRLEERLLASVHEVFAAFKSEVPEVGERAQENSIAFLKENSSSVIAAGTA